MFQKEINNFLSFTALGNMVLTFQRLDAVEKSDRQDVLRGYSGCVSKAKKTVAFAVSRLFVELHKGLSRNIHPIRESFKLLLSS